jgi:hypothetical protein
MLDSVDDVDVGDVSRATMAVGRGSASLSRCDVGVAARWRRAGEVEGLGDTRRPRGNTAKVYALQARYGPLDSGVC